MLSTPGALPEEQCYSTFLKGEWLTWIRSCRSGYAGCEDAHVQNASGQNCQCLGSLRLESEHAIHQCTLVVDQAGQRAVDTALGRRERCCAGNVSGQPAQLHGDKLTRGFLDHSAKRGSLPQIMCNNFPYKLSSASRRALCEMRWGASCKTLCPCWDHDCI